MDTLYTVYTVTAVTETRLFFPNRAFCRMCVSSSTLQWKTSSRAETVRSLRKVRGVIFNPLLDQG